MPFKEQKVEANDNVCKAEANGIAYLSNVKAKSHKVLEKSAIVLARKSAMT